MLGVMSERVGQIDDECVQWRVSEARQCEDRCWRAKQAREALLTAHAVLQDPGFIKAGQALRPVRMALSAAHQVTRRFIGAYR